MVDNKKNEEISKAVIQFAQGLLCVVLIWLVGWFGFSNAWIIASYVLYVFWSKRKKAREEQWQAIRFFSDYDNLKNTKNLPSWVRDGFIYFTTLIMILCW